MTFDTKDFVDSHGHKPRGMGYWAFEVDGNRYYTPCQMLLGDAKKWLVHNCGVNTANRVTVLS